MSKSQLLGESSKIGKRNIPDPQIRLDFEPKIYCEYLKADLLLVKKNMPENRSLKMLDIGCGKGRISVLLSNMGFSVCGIDVEQTKGKQLAIQERKWQEAVLRGITITANSSRFFWPRIYVNGEK